VYNRIIREFPAVHAPYIYRGLARTICIRCIYGIFGREITEYTVIYGADVRFWPTLGVHIPGTAHADSGLLFLHGSRCSCLGPPLLPSASLPERWKGILKRCAQMFGIGTRPHICRVGQNCTSAPCMTVCICMVITLLKTPCVHRIYLWMYGSGQPYISGTTSSPIGASTWTSRWKDEGCLLKRLVSVCAQISGTTSSPIGARLNIENWNETRKGVVYLHCLFSRHMRLSYWECRAGGASCTCSPRKAA